MASTPATGKPTKLSPHAGAAAIGAQSLNRTGPKTPIRGRPYSEWQSRLSLRRVVGTTCCSPTGFDSVASSFAYIAGGAVVVVDVADAPAGPAADDQRYDLLDALKEPSPNSVREAGRLSGLDGLERPPSRPHTAGLSALVGDMPNRRAVLEDATDAISCNASLAGAIGAPRSPTRDVGQIPSPTQERPLIGALRRSSTDPRTPTADAQSHFPERDSYVQPPSTNQTYTQRFFRARPTAVPVYLVSPAPGAPTIISSAPATPKASDSRNRIAAAGIRDLSFNPQTQPGSPTGRTWTSRERIKAATCLSLSRDGRYLAVGETGYAPRVLIFGLQDVSSSDVPLVSISEHAFGVQAVAWSADSRYLASLGAANDGFIYVWSIDHRTGAAKLFQQNRCTSTVRGMAWMGNLLITLGVRHMKAWRVDDPAQSSPTRTRFIDPNVQKPLPGRNVLLGSLIEATFTCAAVIDDNTAIICTDTGEVCLLDNSGRQMRLSSVQSLEFPISSITIRDGTAFVGGKSGQFSTLSVRAMIELDSEGCILTKTEVCTGVVALAFLENNLVTVDSSHSIDIWDPAYRPGQPRDGVARIPIPGHGEAILGIQPLDRPNPIDAAFVTWAGSGKITAWSLDGRIRSQLDVPVEQPAQASEIGVVNQLTCVRVTSDGGSLVAADRLGTLRVVDLASSHCVLDTKAHSAECQSISIYRGEGRSLVASCGRDRTVQLFHKPADAGAYEHFQTLEFTSRVVQVLIPSHDRVIACALDRTVQIFDVVSREGEPDVLAAISARVITLRSSPTSMVLGPGVRTAFVSLLDRSVVQYDLGTGKQVSAFKCNDESSAETAVLESLTILPSRSRERDLLVGVSNTDKSVRIYDASTGEFLDREWGHTEAINGAALAEDDDGTLRVVSIGSDGTMMIWGIDSETVPSPTAGSRDSSPTREGAAAAAAAAGSRQPLRRVLSKQELAEFQKTAAASPGRRSPPRSLRHKVSRTNLAAAAASARPTTTPIVTTQSSGPYDPGRANHSPPESPRAARRPSLANLSAATMVVRKKSSTNLRSAAANSSSGSRDPTPPLPPPPLSMNAASDQLCQTLRTLRKRIAKASEPVSADSLEELERELRLTAAAIGDRSKRRASRASTRPDMTETAMTGLLDMYSERILTMLDERLSLGIQGGGSKAGGGADEDEGSVDLDMDGDGETEAEREPRSPVGRRRRRRQCSCAADDADDEVVRTSLPSPSPSG